MKPKDLCLQLAQLDSEHEIIELLKKEMLWDNPNNWQLFGDDENNYSTIGNQQSKPEAAIVEKIINSVDAILMSECLKWGMQPDSDKVPQSIKEALVKFFNIDDGKLSNLSSRERSKLADNILFIATGKKTNPTFTVIDNGEGQTPAKLKDTILSIKKSNKLKIPFVQGKFNMGGTGVFRFCGEENIQLVISKRNPLIDQSNSDPTKDYWGFTVIRRENPQKGARSSNYKYLAPSNQIFFFEAPELLLLPSEYPNPYGKPMYSGTFIKFFEYKIGPGLRANILFDLYNKLSLLMPHIALPVKMYERRNGYKGHSFETVLSGLSVRVDEDRSGNIEEGFPTSGSIVVTGQKMKYSIYVFKKGSSEKFTKEEGIIFTINGQTHGFLSKAFFTRKNVGLNYLSDSILVILDCSEIEARAREDLFMNSRDRLSNCPLKSDIEKRLEEELSNNQGLRLLKEKRRKEEIENKLKDSKPLVNLIKDVLEKSPSLSRLFIQGMALQNPFKTTGATKQDIYVGKEFPSFFSLSKKYPVDKPKLAHINSKFRIEFKTDVNNDYFDRAKDPGTWKLLLNEKEYDSSINLWNGFAHLNIATDNFKIGEKFKCQLEIMDVSKYQPLSEEFNVYVSEPSPTYNTNSGQRKPPASNLEGSDTLKNDGFSIPNIIPVTKSEWEDKGFTKLTALVIKGSQSDGYDFFINIDNINLLTELKQVHESEIQITEAKYKFGLVLIGLALLNQTNENPETDDASESVFKKIENITSALSPIIIPMISSLGQLEADQLSIIGEEAH